MGSIHKQPHSVGRQLRLQRGASGAQPQDWFIIEEIAARHCCGGIHSAVQLASVTSSLEAAIHTLDVQEGRLCRLGMLYVMLGRLSMQCRHCCQSKGHFKGATADLQTLMLAENP